MNHTKGPWSQGHTEQGKSAVWTDGRKEAQGNMGPPETWIDCNTEANARLIAAAPCLLAAIVRLISSDEGLCKATNKELEYAAGNSEDPVVIEQAAAILQCRDAIAKATGAA